MTTQTLLLKTVSLMAALEFNGCIRTLTLIDLTPSYDKAYLRVVVCTLAQPEQVND